MSICASCNARQERPCTYVPMTREYYRVLVRALRHVAYRNGYALTVHGSLKTDIDLVAVPWREGAVSQENIAEEIRSTAEKIIGVARKRQFDVCPEQKPCGRLAWSFYLVPEGISGPYIDLSVMPILRPVPAKRMPRK